MNSIQTMMLNYLKVRTQKCYKNVEVKCYKRICTCLPQNCTKNNVKVGKSSINHEKEQILDHTSFVGSNKQVKWAMDILVAEGDDGNLIATFNKLHNSSFKIKASYIIENRDKSQEFLLKYINKNMN